MYIEVIQLRCLETLFYLIGNLYIKFFRSDLYPLGIDPMFPSFDSSAPSRLWARLDAHYLILPMYWVIFY